MEADARRTFGDARRRLITRHKQSFSSEYSFMQHAEQEEKGPPWGKRARHEMRRESFSRSIPRRHGERGRNRARSRRRLQGKYWFQAAVTCNYPLPPPLRCCICLFATTISLFPPASGRIWNYCSDAKYTPTPLHTSSIPLLYFFLFQLWNWLLRFTSCL